MHGVANALQKCDAAKEKAKKASLCPLNENLATELMDHKAKITALRDEIDSLLNTNAPPKIVQNKLDLATTQVSNSLKTSKGFDAVYLAFYPSA